MRLTDLPKAFRLRDILDKGFFPHLFNTAAKSNYIGYKPIPYSPERMFYGLARGNVAIEFRF